jgi:hypothetical protein
MSFTEQAALFAQAEHVVGVTGAGLANMLFSEDCIYSIIYGDVLWPSFYYLAQCLPVEFNPITGRSVEIDDTERFNWPIYIEDATLGEILE